MPKIEERLSGLMQRDLAGDASATRELLTVLALCLRGYFRRRIDTDGADVEDLVQETLLAIHLKRETFDPDEPVTAWIFAIARHKLIDWYRRRKERRTIPLEDADALFARDELDQSAAREDVAHLLEALPEKQAAAIHCMKVVGLSAEETASVTGQSVSAVKVGVHRGLRKLAAWLRGSGK